MLGINRRKFGANAFYSARYPDQYEETLTSLAAWKLIRSKGPGRWTFSLYSRLNRDHFLLDRNQPSFYRNNHLSHGGGAEIKYRRSWWAGVSQTGISYRNESIRSTSLGEERENPPTAWLDDSLVYTHGTGRNLLGWNLNHSWQAGPLRLSGGFLVSLHAVNTPDTGPELGLYPGLDVQLALPLGLHAFASVNRSMRLPTFTDLYYQGPTNRGNPSLSPEKALSWEAGLTRKNKHWYVEMQGWFRQGRQLIDWVWMEDERWHTLNYSRINALGAAAMIRYSPEHARPRSFRLRSASLSYAFGHQLKLEEDYVSRYALDYLKHKAVSSVRWELGKLLGLSMQGIFQDRAGGFLAYDSVSGATEDQEYDPFFLLDLRLDYKRGRFLVFADVSNLFNWKYYDIGNVPQPGFWMTMGLNFR